MKNFLANLQRILVAPLDWIAIRTNWNCYSRESAAYLFPLNPTTEELKSLGISRFTLNTFRKRVSRDGFLKIGFSELLNIVKVKNGGDPIAAAAIGVFPGIGMLIGMVLGILFSAIFDNSGSQMLTFLGAGMILGGIIFWGSYRRERHLSRLFKLAEISDSKMDLSTVNIVDSALEKIQKYRKNLSRSERKQLRRNLDNLLHVLIYSFETGKLEEMESARDGITSLGDLAEEIGEMRIALKMESKRPMEYPKMLVSRTIEPQDLILDYPDYKKSQWESVPISTKKF